MQPNYRATRHACYVGSMTQAICNNLTPLLFIIFQSAYGLSYQRLGALILINFVVQLTVDLLCARYADKIGYRVPLVVAHAASALGLVLLAALPHWLADPYAGLCVAVVVYAFGGGLLEVLVSPVVDSLPKPQAEKAASMALLHSFYCWGQVAVVLLSTLLLRAIGGALWWVLPIVWAAVPLANMVAFLRVPFVPMIPEHQRTSLRELLKKPLFLAFLTLMVCAGAAELVVSQWASLFAEQGLGLSKVWGDLLGPCLFGVMMGVGRVIYGVWGARMDLRRFLLVTGLLCVACYLVLCLAPFPGVSLAACAVTGFAVSLFWPGTCSLSSARFPMGGAAMFALLAMFGDIGCSAGPWLAGLVADQAGTGFFGWVNEALFGGESALKTGILVATVFPLVLVVTVCAAGRGMKETKA